MRPADDGSALLVRTLRRRDRVRVREIHAEGLASGNAGFDRVPPTWRRFRRWAHPQLRIVAVVNGEVVGWAAAGRTGTRPTHRGVVRHSVYVASSARRTGAGLALLDELVRRAPGAGVWTIESEIFPENTASLQLHLRAGFRVVGRRERIARMTYGPWAGLWRDSVVVEFRHRDDPAPRP